MKLISESLGVARSQLTVRLNPGAQIERHRRVLDDTALVDEIRTEVSELPSYGYRRVWGLLRRRRETHSLAPINVKRRVYRVIRDHQLLLERRIKQPGVARRHEGRIAVATSNTRWCSDGLSFVVRTAPS
ncbi:IS3 family transposase [Pseudomonas chlororaphis subsp. aurantiaca]|nr:IS3 family transposase [Pseudomonas chlororaphis subsp. aurantiaca]